MLFHNASFFRNSSSRLACVFFEHLRLARACLYVRFATHLVGQELIVNYTRMFAMAEAATTVHDCL
jgi:hypothetical protein